MSLEVKRLEFSRGTFSLKGIDITVPDGSILGIGGQNGSGKSTLMKLLYGFYRPDVGNVYHNGISLSELHPRDISRKIAVVSQEISEPFNFTALEVVKLSGYSRDNESISPHEAMETCGISHLANRNFSELSGGEKRLVLIAAAVYQDASTILMDEPTAFLDVDKEQKVKKIIQDLNGLGRTLVLVLHDINLLNSLCTHVVLLRDGAIIASGEKEEVLSLENLEKAYTLKFRILEDAGPYKFAPAEI